MRECYQQGTPLENEQKELKIGLQKKIKDSCFFAFCNQDVMGSYIFNSN